MGFKKLPLLIQQQNINKDCNYYSITINTSKHQNEERVIAFVDRPIRWHQSHATIWPTSGSFSSSPTTSSPSSPGTSSRERSAPGLQIRVQTSAIHCGGRDRKASLQSDPRACL